MKHPLTKVMQITWRLVAAAGLVVAILPHTAAAATVNPAPAAQISFTFDDGLASADTYAAPIMQKYALPATEYIPTACMGTTGYCPENQDASYMTWPQVQALQNTYGWEIGSHTVDTPCLASSAQTDPADCPNATPLTTAQIDAELANSQSTLASYGIKAVDFAPPFGDYNANVIAQTAKYYANLRQFQNTANNTNAWPYSDYFLQDYPVLEKTTPVSSVETAINNAITNKQWLVLTFHDVVPSPSSNPDDYQYGTSELTQLAAYVQSKENAGLIKATTVNNGTVSSTTNLLPNGSFSSGISGGWTTDNPTDVVADTGGNGSYPNATYSVKVTTPSSGANVHLFSPHVSVNSSTTYMFKNFLNLQSISSGEVAYYVDEYDANGNWISGQYLKQETGPFAEDMNFTYKPSSPSVSNASLQTIANGAGINAYLSNSQMFPLTTPTLTNLVPNGTFDAGISGGWTTDAPATIVADNGNHGGPNNPVNSVAMTATAANTHLFSPHVTVSSTHSYSITSYLNLTAVTSGEVGFYMDEYNSSGQWISGKYITGVHTVGAGDVGFNYTPTSANVATASLQVIVVGNSGIHAYFDDVRWYQN